MHLPAITRFSSPARLVHARAVAASEDWKSLNAACSCGDDSCQRKAETSSLRSLNLVINAEGSLISSAINADKSFRRTTHICMLFVTGPQVLSAPDAKRHQMEANNTRRKFV
jgi:hypothetical protein